MLHKFDILFKKTLKSGGIKVVTYGNLLENSEAFGDSDGFAGAEGELSMVLEGSETGYSINALMRKYRSQLVGNMNAEMFGGEFPLRFVFARPDDLLSIRAELRDENGYTYSSDVHTIAIEGSKTLNLKDNKSFLILIAKEKSCDVYDDNGTSVNIESGQVVFCSESTRSVTIKAEKTVLIVV